MLIKFWGVRGSVPTPLTPAQVEAKVLAAVQWVYEGAERVASSGVPITAIPFEIRSTFGGNTTCVEVNCGEQLFILDMGTGVRELGNEQMKKLMHTKKLNGTILQSHVHWDHIQGLPFWKPLYLPRRVFDCRFEFFGGKSWDSQLDLVYRGQMNAPVFPVNLEELEHTSMNMEFKSIYDGWEQRFETEFLQNDQPKVLARKLFHPQETFGYRISFKGNSLAFTTDHEPYADGLPKPLIELVDGVDIWITDCQYSHDEYIGKVGPQKMGWGHSFPEYIAAVAKEAKPKKIITTHHDPESSDVHILNLARQVQELSGIETIPAYEGLSLTL